MTAARALAALALMAWAGTAFAQIRVVNPKLIAPAPATSVTAPAPNNTLMAPPPNNSLTMPARTIQAPQLAPFPVNSVPLQPIQTTQPPAGTTGESTPAPQSSGGTLIGSPLPPPPQAPQNAAAAKHDQSIEPGEVAVVTVNLQAAQQVLQQAQQLGLSIERRAVLGHLGLVVSVFRVPQGVSVQSALAQLRQAMPSVWSDANHRYTLEAGPARYGERLVGWPARSRACGAGLRVGMIDTAIDLSHPAFRGGRVTLRSFLAAGVAPASPAHGTAVASLLVGGEGFGLLGGARLYAAAVFRKRGDDGADTDAELAVRALDWLAGERVAAVNLSFGGPRNRILEAAVLRMEQLGIEVVAAAGNGGAEAPPVYPAAQAGVVAVTAIDARLRPYVHANHGNYITFSAPGVDVWAAAPDGSGKYESGTSYAVPFATAIFAAARAAQPGAGPDALEKGIQARAKDLGAPGRDPVFGWGLVQATGCGTSSRKRH